MLSCTVADRVTAADEDLLLRPDTEVARAEATENRILPTLDVGFADLRKYPPGSHSGSIPLRLLSLGPEELSSTGPRTSMMS
jgi:hypothetical protein